MGMVPLVHHLGNHAIDLFVNSAGSITTSLYHSVVQKIQSVLLRRSSRDSTIGRQLLYWKHSHHRIQRSPWPIFLVLVAAVQIPTSCEESCLLPFRNGPAHRLLFPGTVVTIRSPYYYTVKQDFLSLTISRALKSMADFGLYRRLIQ